MIWFLKKIVNLDRFAHIFSNYNIFIASLKISVAEENLYSNLGGNMAKSTLAYIFEIHPIKP